MKSEYLLVLAVTLIFPLIMSVDKNLPLRRYPVTLFAAMFLVAVPFWIWDVWVTARGHWSFNPDFVLGFYILGLPLEEWLFFLVVPFVSIFTWESVRYFLKDRT